MKEINTALLINSVYGVGGGAETIATHLLETLPTKGIDTNMIVGVKQKDSPRVTATPKNPINIILKYVFRNEKYNVENIFRILTGLNDIFFAWPFLLFFRPMFWKTDVINLHNLHGHYFSILSLPFLSRRKKVFWTLHDTWAIMGKSPTINGECNDECFKKERCEHMDVYPKMYKNRTRFLKKLKKFIYKHSDLTLICPSDWLKSEVIKSNMFPEKTQIVTINNGIELERFENLDKQNLRNNFGLPADKKIVLFQSAWITNPEKGIVDAIKNIKLKNTDDVFFLIIGYTSEDLIPELERQNIKYKNLSFLPNNEVIKYFAASDVLAFPSWYENLSTTLIESLAAGTPAVAFDTGGNKEIIDHEKNGYLAKWKDYTGFWNGVEYVLNLEEKTYSEFSNTSRRKAQEKFSLEKFINSYHNLFKADR